MEIRYKAVNNLPVIPVTINGKMGLVLIDSGASSSMLDSTVKSTYKFKIGSRSDKDISGIGGSRGMYHTKDAEIKYRSTVLKMSDKLMTSDMREIRKAIGVVGILGSDFLSANNAVIDYKNKVIKL